MNKEIDCFFVGQNQITFQEYEKSVRRMGTQSGAYRDLNVNTLQLNNGIYSAADIFNLFCGDNPGIEPIKRVETFAAGIAYLGTYLHRHGFTFDYINSFQDEKEYLEEQIQGNEVLTVAILTTFYVTPLPIVEIIRFIRQYNQTAKILVGGPFVSTKFRTSAPTEMDYLLNSMEADVYVNSSQGETALVNIISSIKNNQPLDKINNIYYKAENGYVSTPVVREENILAENMVNWELFADRVGGFANVRTCISCPFSCAFCGFPEHAGKHQVAGVEAIEEELNRLNKIKSLKSIHFVDDTFNVPVKRFKELLKMMIKNDYVFKWNSFFRCQYADEETVKLMKESGCESVLLGIESGNEQILNNMNKFASLEKYYEGIAWLKKYGIVTLGNFIVGFPGETEETIRGTIDFIKKSDLDFYRAQLWYFEPITPIGRQREKYDMQGESFEWSHKTMNSQQACDWVERIIFSLDEKDKIRYPQYYFDYDNVTQLIHKGITMDQVKKYLKSFDNAVKIKLKNPSRKEVTFESIQQIRESCQVRLDSQEPSRALNDGPGNQLDTGEAEFDF